MENFRNCPICSQVPEKEIYQCTEGHVICNLCISKVGNNCPQCRTPFGPTKIRSRVLEELLDGQEFECKFNYQGCTKILKRGEITSHSNSCSFKPIPLCQQIGIKDCNFTIGQSASKSEIVSHFEEKHDTTFHPPLIDMSLTISGETLRLFTTEGQRSGPNPGYISVWPGFLFTMGELETSPLILLIGKADFIKQSLSFMSIQVFGDGSSPCTTKLALFKDTSSSKRAVRESMSSLTKLFPMRWSMNSCNIQDAHYVAEEPPINISIPLLQKCQFGTNKFNGLKGDYFNIEVCSSD